MFAGCTSLIQAPELLATKLSEYCYASMFAGCTSLTQAPELPATELADGCYEYMFNYCENLQQIKVGFTSWLDSATTEWVYRVASEGTFNCPQQLQLKYGDSNIPEGWTVGEPVTGSDILVKNASFTDYNRKYIY